MMMTESQREMMRTYGTLVGRVLIGLLFLVTGVQVVMGGVAGFGSGIAGMGIPLAGVVAWVVVLVKILGGAGLILGYRVGLSAAALFVFTLLTVVLVHNDATQMTAALKNLAIIGGLLYILAYGPGEGWKLSK